MLRLLGYVGAAATFLLWPCAASAANPLPADPYALFIAGKKVIAISADARLWRRGLEQDAAWSPLPLGPGETFVSSVMCAADGSGACIVTASTGEASVLDKYDGVSDKLTRLPNVVGAVVGVQDADTILLSQPGKSDSTSVVSYSISRNQSEPVGVLAPGEQLLPLPLGGAIKLAAFSYGGDLHMHELATGTPVDFAMVENLLWTPDSLMVRELWTHEPSVVPGRRSVVNIRFDRQVKDGQPIWHHTEAVATAVPVSGPIFDETNGATDANGDLVAELVYRGTDKIGVLCKMAKDSYGFRSFLDVPPGQTVRVSGSLAGGGFILRTDSMLHTPKFDILTLSSAPGGWRGRICDDTTVTTLSADVVTADNPDLELVPMQATSGDGTTVPYYVLKPKDMAPGHVLIDVYGAYGYKHVFEAYHREAIASMRETRTAIAFAIVRGDGDLGYDYAVASRSPYRNVAVDDVTAVAQDIAAHYPDMQDKPTVRGQSAGAWLAMKTVLTHPSLFSGAIGYSGMYLIKDDPLANGANGYFTGADDLSQMLPAARGACPRLHFRFLHAKDDPKAKYDKAVAFSDRLKAAGCPVEFESFDHGGHNIDIYPGQEADGGRRLKAYFTPF